ncbi:MAG: hypothetical protein DMF51_14835 [Acidobacteria bacterium]|nr:MAG: hypothetical protein DMF51_14835 [Acidobacteriota bacterium]
MRVSRGAARRRWPGLAAALGCCLGVLAPTVSSAPQRPGSLRFVVVAPRAVRLGKPVPVTLRLSNAGTRKADLYLLGRTITFDIIVAGPDGRVRWRRLEGASGQQILQVKTLAPGETLELRDVWTQRTNAGAAVSPGVYTVQGVLPTDAAPLQTTLVRVRITPD